MNIGMPKNKNDKHFLKKLFLQEGKLLHKDMKVVWQSYPKELHPWLLRLTEEFDLTFPLSDEEANLVPCLLPDTVVEVNIYFLLV